MDDGASWEGEQDHMEWKVDTSEVVVSEGERAKCLCVCVCTYVCLGESCQCLESMS